MQIVISISEEDYKNLIKYGEPLTCGNQFDDTIMKAVANGVILPEGHGDLKDIGKCNRELFYQQCGGANSLITTETAFDMLLALPTIIEAEKAESEESCNNDGWCNTCEFKYLESECCGCAIYDEYGNLITLSNYKKEGEVE